MAYEVVDGPVLRAEDISQSLLDRIASYCAFRTGEFRLPNASPDPLAQMLTLNVEREFGVELQLRPEELESSALVLTDGRMQPHEWIMNPRGTATKTDACAHGDDHFFPGPCDIAWDLAGAAVEWNLSSDATEHLLSRFHRLTGDDVTKRFPAYALAYNVFRLAWCKMAISTVTGTDEESRIHQAYLAYRKRAHDLLCLRQPQRLQSVAS